MSYSYSMLTSDYYNSSTKKIEFKLENKKFKGIIYRDDGYIGYTNYIDLITKKTLSQGSVIFINKIKHIVIGKELIMIPEENNFQLKCYRIQPEILFKKNDIIKIKKHKGVFRITNIINEDSKMFYQLENIKTKKKNQLSLFHQDFIKKL